MTLFKMIIAAAFVWLAAVIGPAHAAQDIGFHFYGAEDCPPCMAFKRDGLPLVERSARDNGFAVAVNITAKTRTVPNVGIYGAQDPLLRKAATALDIVYPPIFFITKGDEIFSVHKHDWKAALKAAELAVK